MKRFPAVEVEKIIGSGGVELLTQEFTEQISLDNFFLFMQIFIFFALFHCKRLNMHS